jgi:hypothetical protein
LIEALPAAAAAEVGKSSMRTSNGGESATISINRTELWASASTSAACGNATARSSGLTKKRSATSMTSPPSVVARRNVRIVLGVTRTARVRAWERQNSGSSISPSSSSVIAETSAVCAPASVSWRSTLLVAVFSAIRSASPLDAGSVGR